MKYLVPIILFIFCFYSCGSNESDNAKQIRSIDEIKAIDTLYEFKVDIKERIIDTLSMQQYKKNEKGLKVFSELTSLKNSSNKIIVKNYFRDNGDLFYSITETPDGILSVYENWLQDGRIYKAATIKYEAGKVVDTVAMVYKYEDDKEGGLKKMIIHESTLEGSPIVEIHYNEEQKPVLEIYMNHNDTLRVERLTYENGKLLSSRITDKRIGKETIQYFGSDEFRNAEKVYANDSLIREVVFSRDKQGNILAKVVK